MTQVMENAQAVATEDVGNIFAMEHVNVTVPDPGLATQFYIVGLGFTRDPFVLVGPENMWVNVGHQQFHLPSKPAQVIPGHIAVVIKDLEALKKRLKSLEPKLAGTRFGWSAEDGHVAVTCPWGNQFRCFAPSPRFGDMTTGIPYVEFLVKPGVAAPIARFYQQVMQAPASVRHEGGHAVAEVRMGTDQALYFRETNEPTRPYDGHHIAVYVVNLSAAYQFFQRRDLLLQDIVNHQYRFKDIIDPDTGQKVFELEHEVRSLYHRMYGRDLINRDPTQDLRGYTRGGDVLRV